MKRVFAASALISILSIVANVLASDAVNTEGNTLSVRTLLTTVDSEKRKALAEKILDKFNFNKGGGDDSIESELLSMLDDPIAGYANAQALQTAFSIPHESNPIVDVSDKIEGSRTQTKPEIFAVHFKLETQGGLELQYPDTLFVYYNRKTFRIPIHHFWGARRVNSGQVVFRILHSVAEEPEGVDHLELWSLSLKASVLTKILDLPITGWIRHGGETFSLVAPRANALGLSLGPIDAYFTEILGLNSPCTYSVSGEEARSPYFLYEHYRWDASSGVYLRDAKKQLDGAQYLLTLSRLVSGHVIERAKGLVEDFVRYGPDPIGTFKSVFANLNKSIQGDALEVLQEHSGIKFNQATPIREYFKELTATQVQWADHHDKYGCNFPWNSDSPDEQEEKQ